MRRTQIVPKVGFHIRRIVLKNVIYLYVQNIYTYPLFEFNLAIQNVFFVQSEVDHLFGARALKPMKLKKYAYTWKATNFSFSKEVLHFLYRLPFGRKRPENVVPLNELPSLY